MSLPQETHAQPSQTRNAQLSQATHEPEPQQMRPGWAVRQERQHQEAAQPQTSPQQEHAEAAAADPQAVGHNHRFVAQHQPEMVSQGQLASVMPQTEASRLGRQAGSQQRMQQHVHQHARAVQQPPQQRQGRQPTSPKPHDIRNARPLWGTSSPPMQPPASSPSRAVAKAPSKNTSPVMAHAVEHSSLSLSQLAIASRSKLRPPSNLHSPPKRASRTALPKQATNSHLVKFAAAVPLPASPNSGDAHGSLDSTAGLALVTALAKPSHIPAPAVKPSRLKKPTNTSGFFSSGRSFTGAGSNAR